MWTVWVGGVEVVDYYLPTLERAESVAQRWELKGYEDVVTQEVV
jgi:hypothetical protein